MRKTFITKMPDETGAFLTASRIIARAGVNITRVSYNKAVDVHTLFIDVSGTYEQISSVSKELEQCGYLSDNISDANVILLEFRLPDRPGAVVPILEIINQYDFNISYMSSEENGTDYQFFKMGLYVEKIASISHFLEAVSKLCHVSIIQYDKIEKRLDNTVFYLSFANEIATKLFLTQDDTNELIANANRIMQTMDERNESPYKTFEYINRFAHCLVRYKGHAFHPRISKRTISDSIILHLIEPPCGSSIYILQHVQTEDLLFVDSGFSCYREELVQIMHVLFPNFKRRKKDLVLTHIDMDHSGALDLFDHVYLSQRSYDNFVLEHEGNDNFRAMHHLNGPFCKIAAILSGYTSPPLDRLIVLNTHPVDVNKPLSYIGTLDFHTLHFDVYEGNGGHIAGETVFVCHEYCLLFTGDIWINVGDLTPEQAEFNMLSPYLMTSVNVDSKKAAKTREEIQTLMSTGAWLVCGGHGGILDIS
ncbi:MAG: hypothetical protein LBV40_01815 [Methanomicrobiales archaeon]|nr:hypothetical protein [Methanomicrobiales archaeon]